MELCLRNLRGSVGGLPELTGGGRHARQPRKKQKARLMASLLMELSNLAPEVGLEPTTP